MLSNPNSGLQQRQRQHRRQNSTPAAFDAPKVPILPAKIQRQSSHRRGQSLDQRNIRQRQLRSQDDKTVSTTNNGLQLNQQHILRETQQQRLARPGQQQRQYLVSQGQQEFSQYQGALVGSCSDSISRPNSQGEIFVQNGHHDVQRLNNLSEGRGLVPNPTMGDFQNLNSMTDNSYLVNFDLVVDENERNFQNSMHTTSATRERSAGTAQAYAAHRRQNSLQEGPRTPQNQTYQDTYPITPATTPYNRVPQTEPGPKRSLEYSFLDGEETVKPTRSQKGMSCRDIFQQGTYNQKGSIPSPPESTRLPLSHNFDVAPMQSPNFMNMASLQMEFSGSETGYDSSYYSPMSSALSPSQGSFQSSPELANMPLFNEAGEPIGGFPIMNINSTLPSSQPELDSVQGKSPQKADLVSGATIIEDLGLDATIEDTGVTVDDIATFINGPGEDGKYTCLYLDCGKRFGRKENIKSHVQTHLGDRQFRCNHCKKCFVRQHDLKRHAKIHSGVKPYPCQCGNSFARHDALTRHRQRGMCVGAFEGVVKKIVKRGRPRKHRPDGEERRDKASRTRKRVQDMSSGSSTSGDSQGYLSQSPHMPFTNASSPESSTFDHLSPRIEQYSQGFSQDMFQFTPPTSPGRQVQEFVSPQQMVNNEFKPEKLPCAIQEEKASMILQDNMVHLPPNSPSPSKSGSSQYNTPPELCLSSSSPPASKFFDLENASEPEGASQDSMSMGMSKSPPHSLPDISEHDELFSDNFASNPGLSSLEKDPMLLFQNSGWPNDMFQDNMETEMFFDSLR